MKTHKIIIQNVAKKDAIASRKWYELQQKGLGKRFSDDLKSTLVNIANNPYSYAIRYAENRKANLKIFPMVYSFLLRRTPIRYMS